MLWSTYLSSSLSHTIYKVISLDILKGWTIKTQHDKAKFVLSQLLSLHPLLERVLLRVVKRILKCWYSLAEILQLYYLVTDIRILYYIITLLYLPSLHVVVKSGCLKTQGFKLLPNEFSCFSTIQLLTAWSIHYLLNKGKLKKLCSIFGCNLWKNFTTVKKLILNLAWESCNRNSNSLLPLMCSALRHEKVQQFPRTRFDDDEMSTFSRVCGSQ